MQNNLSPIFLFFTLGNNKKPCHNLLVRYFASLHAVRRPFCLPCLSRKSDFLISLSHCCLEMMNLFWTWVVFCSTLTGMLFESHRKQLRRKTVFCLSWKIFLFFSRIDAFWKVKPYKYFTNNSIIYWFTFWKIQPSSNHLRFENGWAFRFAFYSWDELNLYVQFSILTVVVK